MKDTTQEQKWMERSAWYHIVAANNTFLEIMGGSNPLTADELRKLAAKRPELWGRFLGYAK